MSQSVNGYPEYNTLSYVGANIPWFKKNSQINTPGATQNAWVFIDENEAHAD